jgi:exodeoxyribonuclease VII small subunit
MTDETYTFEQTRIRLEGILVEVRKRDTSLEQSLELLEEGVRLLNQCNELIDQTAWRPSTDANEEAEPTVDATDARSGAGDEARATEPVDGAVVPGDAEERGVEAAEAEELPDDERD